LNLNCLLLPTGRHGNPRVGSAPAPGFGQVLPLSNITRRCTRLALKVPLSVTSEQVHALHETVRTFIKTRSPQEGAVMSPGDDRPRIAALAGIRTSERGKRRGLGGKEGSDFIIDHQRSHRWTQTIHRHDKHRSTHNHTRSALTEQDGS
jgi:hypothetical protein